MNIVVSLQEKWGKELFYPVSEDAYFLTEFTGRPTLLKHQLKLAKKKGWNVEVKQNIFNLDVYLKDYPRKRNKK